METASDRSERILCKLIIYTTAKWAFTILEWYWAEITFYHFAKAKFFTSCTSSTPWARDIMSSIQAKGTSNFISNLKPFWMILRLVAISTNCINNAFITTLAFVNIIPFDNFVLTRKIYLASTRATDCSILNMASLAIFHQTHLIILCIFIK